MRDNVTRSFGRVQGSFSSFTPGQKVVAVVGTGALLLAGFMVFRWAAAPSYAPLFSNLASSDASAIIQQLDSEGVPYKLSNGGNTIMVPRDQVYAERISLSGEGLPSSSKGGYSLLDNQSLSTSQFQEQTTFKRAMEGELASTIEAIDGVETAVVHLAMPAKQVFSDSQDPTTASVLVQTRAGSTLTPEQVQAVVNLVSASVDGLERPTTSASPTRPAASLSAPGSASAGAASSQNQQVVDFQNRMTAQVQSTLDHVLGPGNATVQVTPVLSFDDTVSETTRYFGNADLALSASETHREAAGRQRHPARYRGRRGRPGRPDGPHHDGLGDRQPARSTTRRAAPPTTPSTGPSSTARRRPGRSSRSHVGVVLDTQALNGRDPAVLRPTSPRPSASTPAAATPSTSPTCPSTAPRRPRPPRSSRPARPRPPRRPKMYADPQRRPGRRRGPDGPAAPGSRPAAATRQRAEATELRRRPAAHATPSTGRPPRPRSRRPTPRCWRWSPPRPTMAERGP